MNRVMAIWLPNWPLQRLQSKRPELKQRPVILHNGTSHRQHVVACSVLAYQRGVRAGMSMAEATALTTIGNQQKAIWHREVHDPVADRQSLEKLAQWCHRFSPIVGLADDEPPETLLLDTTNLAPLFGSEESLANQVHQGFCRLGLATYIAVADNPATAWAVTHLNPDSQVQRPHSLEPSNAVSPLIIPPHQGPALLAPLSIDTLRLPEDVAQTLRHLGIHRTGELLSLPRDTLRSRFGSVLLTRINQVLGEQPEPINPVKAPLEFTAQWLLEQPLSKRELVAQVIQRLVSQLVQMLATRRAGALQLVCWFDCQPGAPVSFYARLFRPSHDVDQLMEIITLQLEKFSFPGPVIAVEVRVTRYAQLAERQRVLFEQDRSWHNSQQLAGLINRLAGRLGRQAVVHYRSERDAQPELACRAIPLVDGPHTQHRQNASQHVPWAALDRPLRLFSRPISLASVASSPSGCLNQFRFEHEQHQIARHWGPERIETGWWRKQGIRRDYYRTETTTGRRFWLFRCLRSDRWFLHGSFD